MGNENPDCREEGTLFSKNCGVGVAVGDSERESVGRCVGDAVGQALVQTLASHRPLRQSPSKPQAAPDAHFGHDPPQSTSISSPFRVPSSQDRVVGATVGQDVGAADGSTVGDCEALIGTRVGTFVGIFVGETLGVGEDAAKDPYPTEEYA